MAMMVAALSTLYVGVVLDSAGVGTSANSHVPIGIPPHVVRFPLLTMSTGLVMLAYGGLGLWAAHHRTIAVDVLPWAWVITTVMMLVNFSWTFGIVPVPPIPGAAQHAGLVWAVTILPVFHAWRSHVELVDDYDYDDDDEFDDGTMDTLPTTLEKESMPPLSEQAPFKTVAKYRGGWDEDGHSVRV